MSFVMICGACWANSIMNVQRYGLYRFKNLFDESMLPTDYKYCRWLGAFVGFWYYWYFVGPDKYMRSDMEKWQPRWGPF